MVSVIIPSYNHAPYLEQRIESILSQSYQDFELIILDDKSPDNSAEIIERYRGHERVSHIVINEVNSGSTFKQWDRGFALAKGEYIWIAESDDYAEPTFLERCVAAMEQNSGAVLCYSDSKFVDENGAELDGDKLNTLIVELSEEQRSEPYVYYNGAQFFRQRLLRYNYLYNASMILFRKSALKGVSGNHTNYRGVGDWCFWGELLLEGDCLRVPEKLNNFRQHQCKVTSQMKSTNNNLIESAELLSYLLELYMDNVQDTSKVVDITRINVMVAVYRMARKYRRKVPADSGRADALLARFESRYGVVSVSDRLYRILYKSRQYRL